jgi:hypothetical protein
LLNKIFHGITHLTRLGKKSESKCGKPNKTEIADTLLENPTSAGTLNKPYMKVKKKRDAFSEYSQKVQANTKNTKYHCLKTESRYFSL